jgi:hypothetical protein
MPATAPTADADSSSLAGKWTYRSFHNRPEPVAGNGVNQVPALVGTVIRVKAHGNNPAGYVFFR